jgi:hypothetical protein
MTNSKLWEFTDAIVFTNTSAAPHGFKCYQRNINEQRSHAAGFVDAQRHGSQRRAHRHRTRQCNLSSTPLAPTLPQHLPEHHGGAAAAASMRRHRLQQRHYLSGRTITLVVPAPAAARSPAQEVVGSVVLRSQLITSIAGVGAASLGGRLVSLSVAQCVTSVTSDGVNGLLPLGAAAVSSRCNLTAAHVQDIAAVAGNWVVVLAGTAAVVAALCALTRLLGVDASMRCGC